MRELINDPFYELIKNYKRCIIDYCLMEDDTPYQGYQSHKDAVRFAMCKVIERDVENQLKAESELNQDKLGETNEEPLSWSMDIERAKAEQISPDYFLSVPDIIGKDVYGNLRYACELPNALSGENIPYWYAFLNTPHGTGYGPEEFHTVNAVLFPNGAESLEAYEWTTDWSDYFDAGHEWWGAACRSVYDKSLNRFVVILASTTD